jgi:Mg-chelatase subunit ChlD
MTTFLRIAHVDISSYALLDDDDLGALQSRHGELVAAIRRYLPGVTASLLSTPQPSPDKRYVDWYCDLAGQPVPLPELPAAQQQLVRDRLQERLTSLRKLARELPKLSPGSEDLAKTLDNATHYPDEKFVYAVGDEPVLTLWGFEYVAHKAGKPATLANTAKQGARNTAARRRSRAWLWTLLLLLGVTALIAAGWWWQQQRDQALDTDLQTALATGLEARCTTTDPLVALAARLDELDPKREKYASLRETLTAELTRCRTADELAHQIAAAGWDCEQLLTLQLELAGHDTSKEPLTQLSGQVMDAVATCGEATDFRDRLAAADGDCPRIMALDAELGAPPEDALPLQQVRTDIDRQLQACETSVRFAEDLDANIAQCEKLRRLDGQLREVDPDLAALQSVRERLAAELVLCDRAQHYRQAMIDAQMDCAVFRQLDRDMQGEDSSREPLRSVRMELDGALEQCKALDDLKQALADAIGDCPKLGVLTEQMQGVYPRNPIFVEVKNRIVEESEICGINQSLEAQLAAAIGNCDALQTLKPTIDAQPADNPLFRPMKRKLADELALCERADQWRQMIAQANNDCPQLKELDPKLQADPGLASAQFEPVRAGLGEALDGCKKIVVAEVKQQKKIERKKKKEQKKQQAKVLCPGVRKKEITPQMALVFDASGSMEEVLFPDASIERRLAAMERGGPMMQLGARWQRAQLKQQYPHWPSRMRVAKQATTRIIRDLPEDVDVGLVKVANCPAARNAGFFPPNQRGALLHQIRRLRPRMGTPLASGIAQAANMLDGVTRPAVMVVISDGRDTCNGDPCAVARDVAKKKPKLIINVVDITGAGAANCAAQATGGRVFKANNAQQLNQVMRRATQEVRGPAECRRP